MGGVSGVCTDVDPDRARDLLTAELTDLDERVRAVQASRAEAAASAPGQEGAVGQHPGDYGSEVNTVMEADLGAETLAEQRRRIVEAIGRLDDGSYGRCAVCGREIDDERLKARPEAVTCREHAGTQVVS